MVTLGPIETDGGRTQVLEWIRFLESAGLFWWEVEYKDNERVQVARERIEEGARPPPWLMVLIDEGMGRVARRLPFVAWMPGPPLCDRAQRVMGFWPRRDVIHKAIQRGEVGVAQYPPMADRVKRGQRWWLFCAMNWYGLAGRNGKRLWVMPGEHWTAERYGKRERSRQ